LFLTTEITPLLALSGLLLGIFALLITPREEEPQINVTFANVFITYPGASAKEVESQVTTPAEHLASEIQGVEHVYSTSSPGLAVLTVRFAVGAPRTDAIVRLYNAFYSKWQPANSAVGTPLIKPKGIDDVPILTATLWSKQPVTNTELLNLARTVQTQLQRVPGSREIDIIGGANPVVNVLFDPQRLAAFNLTLSDVRAVLAAANVVSDAGALVNNGQAVRVQAGSFIASPEDVAGLVVGVYQRAPVFLQDIAEITRVPDHATHYVTYGAGPADIKSDTSRYPAITLAINKKPGENAVDVAEGVIEHLEQLRGVYLPDGIEVSITRNYGSTAADKAQTLIKKLIFASLSVIVLVTIALGLRQSLVVGAAVIVTLAITLFASWAWGFTLNRVSLFALIFSIGILVDDAIVVVENIHRHMHDGQKTLNEAIPIAVDEVGGPTILATFTVIAALLPMAFVSGLMGPYMLPIPINASTGMLISLAVAFIFTPWLYRRLFAKNLALNVNAPAHKEATNNRFTSLTTRLMTPFLRKSAGKAARLWLLAAVLGLITLSIGLVVAKAVMLKMLPFDNKSEFQIMLDMPEGTPLETTQQVLQTLADELAKIPEVTDYQLYAGTAAPINFNGLVRQYYLRQAPHLGDIQVNLTDKHQRTRKSHSIALAARELMAPIGKRVGANVKVVEVPPGPPVLAPLVAEIYGLEYTRQLAVAREVRQAFEATADIVDIDDTQDAAQTKWLVTVDRARAAQLGVEQASIVQAINTALNGEDASFIHNEQAKIAIPVRLSLPAGEKTRLSTLLDLKVRASDGGLVALSQVTHVSESQLNQTIHHKDLLPVVYVTADVAGETDSPLYGLADIYQRLTSTPIEGQPLEQRLNSTPSNPYLWSLKWDGELQITLDTFRDMGIAYAVGLILIYLLVVGMFKSYSVPLIIMAPIPLTLIGILPGHALLQQQFTAPSMIGMIALAGIIVRNSILLVDFIQQEIRSGKTLDNATINAVSVRARPITLTALAAMMGGFFILDDPIFGGLAVSLIFGLMVSTALTLVVIPVVYYAYHYKKFPEDEKNN
jgi:multidrug efflux pump subunit AcrB